MPPSSPSRSAAKAALSLSVLLAFSHPLTAAEGDPPPKLGEVTVTGTREGELKSETPVSITIIQGEAIRAIKPAHPMDIVTRVPGAVLMQTNGEGHTTGIRNPIGTDPVYLYLEDGVPTRATGFFNHNALFEVDLPNAGGLEITRGPGSALQGSDAIGAVFNILTKAPSAAPEASVTLEGGSFGWARLLGSVSDSWGETGVRGSLNLTHTDGWRHRTEYDRRSATVRIDHALADNTTMKAILTATDASMQTGANARLSYVDYERDPTLNYHSIFYRDVKAVRASAAFEHETGNSLFGLTPYMRWNYMQLFASFSTSDPTIQTTENYSAGLQARYRQDFEPWRTRLVTGVDLDYSPGAQTDDRVVLRKGGEYYTGFIKGATIYDYDVTFSQMSPYLHVETSPIEALRLTGGLRGDVMHYNYDNHLRPGAFTTTNALGTGNTTLRRMVDTDRYFSHLSPSYGATYAFDPALNVFGRYKHSFRVPSQSQLFRSGSSTDTLHLNPIKVDTYEAGLRGPDQGPLTWELATYHTLKRDDILSVRDAAGTTISSNNGKTRHRGFEAALGWQFLPEWRADWSGAYARHRYASWVNTSGDFTGNDIPSAPRRISNLALAWQPKGGMLDGLWIEAEWVHVGQYRVDDANIGQYRGHDLANLRAAYRLYDSVELFGRVMNVADQQWATCASYSNSRMEYCPGLPRTFYGGLTMQF